jgi:DNA-binding MarR family transcriptional regulator
MLLDSRFQVQTVTACWLSFSNMQKVLVETVDRELKSHAGVDLDDYEVLAFIYASCDRRARMSEISEAVISPKSRLTYQIDQLEKRGLIARSQCPQDRRGLYATITSEGISLVERAAPVYDGIIRNNFTEPVGPDSMLEMLRISNTIRHHVATKPDYINPALTDQLGVSASDDHFIQA